MNNKNMDGLVEFLSKYIDFDSLSAEEAEKSKNEIIELLVENTFLRALGDGSEETLVMFTEFLEGDPDSEQVTFWLHENIPNFAELFKQEVMNLVKD